MTHLDPIVQSAQSSSGRRPWLTLSAYYAVFISLGLVTAVIGPTLPGLAERTSSNLAQISVLFAARSLGYLLGSSINGRLYDRGGGNKSMAVLVLGVGLFMALIPLVSNLWLLSGLIFAIGLAQNGIDIGGNTMLVWLLGKRVGPYMNGLHFFFGLGAFLSPVVVAQAMLISGDIPWAYWSLALLILPPALLLLIARSPVSGRIAVGQVDIAPAQKLPVILVSAFFFLYVGAEVGAGGWIYTYALAQNLAGKTQAAYLTSAFWGALMLGRLVSVPLANVLRPRSLLLADLLGALASMALLLALPGSKTALWAGTLILGFALASAFPTMMSMAGRHMTITGKVTGWFFIGAGTGSMILPWLIGQLFSSLGPRIFLWLIAVDLIAALLLLISLLAAFQRSERQGLHSTS